MNGLLQTLLANGGSSQLLEMVLNWAFSQPMATNLCKSLNWDIANAKQTILGIIDYASKSYSQRVPFEKTLEQRVSDTTRIYQEMCGYESLTEFERRLLSAKLSGFNAKEIQIGMNLQDKYSVEQIANITEEAHKKFLESTKKAGVSAIGGNVETSAIVDLQNVFSKISGSVKSAETPKN